MAESQLRSAIRSKNIAAIIFYLKTKGKGRDYIERTEQDVQASIEGSLDIGIEKLRKVIRGEKDG
jgi:hypothetical protein